MSSCSSSTAAKDMFAVPIEKPWIVSLEAMMNDYSSDKLMPNDFPTIFKVPNYLRSHDPKAYEPTIVSLGPYHHHCSRDHPQSLSISKLKLYYLKKFLQRNSEYSLTDYINMIKDKEMEARIAYSEEVNMSSDYFVRMMLLDCCFVIEIINSIHEYVAQDEVVHEEIEAELVNPILNTPGSLNMVVIDMLVLENQLPFFLLELLFDCVYEHQKFLRWVLSGLSFPIYRVINEDNSGGVYHFLHLFHLCIAPPTPCNQDNNVLALEAEGARRSLWDILLGYFYKSTLWDILLGYFYKAIYITPSSLLGHNGLRSRSSAVQLMEAGVDFEKSEETNFLCITFDKGKMKIPTLVIDNDTNVLFRNLIAFEQFYSKCRKTHYQYYHKQDEQRYVTAYASLIDCIIKTKTDVNLLDGKNIIKHELRNGEEVAHLFNNLCKGVVVDDNETYLSNVFMSVNKHCKSRRTKWKAKLIKWMAKLYDDYFSSPWACMALCGALTLFLLTGASTIYTVLSYYYK